MGLRHPVTLNEESGRALTCVLKQSKKPGGAAQCPCVAVCCSVLQCVAVCCSVLQCDAVCCSLLQSVAVCCSLLQSVAVCCSLLQSVAVCCNVFQCVPVCSSVLQCAEWGIFLWMRSGRALRSALNQSSELCGVAQYPCVAVCCSVLQCVAVCCSVEWHSTHNKGKVLFTLQQHTHSITQATHCNTLQHPQQLQTQRILTSCGAFSHFR